MYILIEALQKDIAQRKSRPNSSIIKIITIGKYRERIKEQKGDRLFLIRETIRILQIEHDKLITTTMAENLKRQSKVKDIT